MTDTVMADRPDALDLEDELLDFTADLLSLKANQSFVVALFAQAKGQWVNVSAIAGQLEQAKETLMALETAGGGRLQVTWLIILRRMMSIVWCCSFWSGWAGII